MKSQSEKTFAEMSLTNLANLDIQTTMEELAAAVIKLREQKQFSKYQLSQFSGISENLITDIESEKTETFDPDILRKLSEALGADQNYLLFLAGHLDDSVPECRDLIKVNKSEEKQELLKYLDFIHSDHTHGYL